VIASGPCEIYTNIVLPEATAWHMPYLDTRASGYTESVRSRLLLGRNVPAIDYLAGVAARQTLTHEVDALFDDADALVLPTLPIVAPLLGAETVALASGAAPVPVRAAMLRHTQLFNLSGHPAITLPVASAGLPVGLQLVGRRGMTGRLLEIAAGCEEPLNASWP
jgi:aspartyl-tRNA(Asn)/glutamyl-tRNA(Gln) amidotransferase subunit A